MSMAGSSPRAGGLKAVVISITLCSGGRAAVRAQAASCRDRHLAGLSNGPCSCKCMALTVTSAGCNLVRTVQSSSASQLSMPRLHLQVVC